jgi:hypothetical protein
MVEDNQKPVTEIELSDSITYIQKPTTELTDTIIIKKNNESRTSIKNNINNQDSQQRMGVISTIFLELYKMVTLSLLVLFVPQSCKCELCTYREETIEFLSYDAN